MEVDIKQLHGELLVTHARVRALENRPAASSSLPSGAALKRRRRRIRLAERIAAPGSAHAAAPAAATRSATLPLASPLRMTIAGPAAAAAAGPTPLHLRREFNAVRR
jgi:hypothetical protein